MYLHAFLLTCITVDHTVLVSSFNRAMLCIRGTSHEPVSVCVRLCLSVCVRLSQVGVLLKRLNGGSQKQHHYSYSLTDVNIFSFRYYSVNKYNTAPHDTPKDASFLMPMISAKFDRGHPLRSRAPNAGGVGQNRRVSTNNQLYLEDGTRQTQSFY